jgi:protein-S-isoprenylcysteine O-methyltransferase Ste14
MFEARGEKRVPFGQLAQRIRVPVGFLLAPLLFISARPTVWTLAAGAVVAAIGLSIRAWASGYLRKNQELTTSGPYAHTRNPLYLGTFILGTGLATGGGALWFIILFMALYLIIYVPVMHTEAEYMRHLFAAEYEHYSRDVPLFLPRLTAYRAAAKNGFERALYLRHREYRAAVGAAVVLALLAAKLYLNSPH